MESLGLLDFVSRLSRGLTKSINYTMRHKKCYVKEFECVTSITMHLLTE